jgi:AmmeMemoRadiSam system protein A
MQEEHHPLVRLAAAAIDAFIRHGRKIDPSGAPVPIHGAPAGVFVTLHSRRSGSLRGCIGTIEPSEQELAREVINNAISAATRDPRFAPVDIAEIVDLDIEVSVLYAPERIASKEQLDPRRYGVIVQKGWRRGLLLPDIEGIDDVETQIAYAKSKAGIGPTDAIALYRFRVEKFT